MAGKSILAVLSLLSLIILIVLPGLAHTRSLPTSDSTLVSDGVNDLRRPMQFLRLGGISASDTCDETYGFMPCTSTAIGNLFLILVYGYFMYIAATYLSNGSELLLEILGPGIVGGLFLPILGALPDALLILVSGLSGSTTTAQAQVSVGMGLLAGSTVMLLTVIWGSCVIVGKSDIERPVVEEKVGAGDEQSTEVYSTSAMTAAVGEQSAGHIRATGSAVAVDEKDTKGFSLTGSGVSVDIWTTYAAMIMIISVIPFIIVQIPSILQLSSGSTLAVLISLIASLTLLLAYCLYQVFQPWIQKRRLAYAKHKHVITGILKYLRRHALGRLFDNGEPNRDIIKKLFEKIDNNGDNFLEESELKALIVGIHFTDIDLDKAVAKVLQDFDVHTVDGKIDFEEFVIGLSKWFKESKLSVRPSNPGPDTMKMLTEVHMKTDEERALIGGDHAEEVEQGEQSDEIVEGVENPKWVSLKAGLMLLVGTIIAAIFADPLVDAVDNFSTATSIPSFFISFIALPLATNSSEAVSAIIFSSRKTRRTSSLTFSELYGAATMNNVLCLSVFLAIVYIRGLTWDFSAEVLVILIVCIVMGLLAGFRTTFPLWMSSIAFLLYPFSLALVYVLDYILGWS